MRIGLVLFGHLRSFRNTHESYKNFLTTLQQAGHVDVFCHTWDIEESVTASWWKEHKPGDIPPATVNEEEIKEKYRPVRYTIEPTRQFDDSGYDIKTAIPVAGILSMLHSQYQAFQLLERYGAENNISYDVVIKTRYDLAYEIAPAFPGLLTTCIEENCLYLPTSNPFELLGCFSDVFAIGSGFLMKDYFSFCTSFREAVSMYSDIGYNRLIPELCLTKYLASYSISCKELNHLRIHILRTNGEKFQINSDKSFDYNNPLCFNRKIRNAADAIHPNGDLTLAVNMPRLIKKYTSWIDEKANEEVLNDYVLFYSGAELNFGHIKRLIMKLRHNKKFATPVVKDFFEESMYHGKYSAGKKFLLASLLTFYGGHGLFFLRVWGNQLVKKR